MKILFENVDFNSRSGPNGFGLKLARQLIKSGNEIVVSSPDICLSFIQSSNSFLRTVLRLDGIYFNSAQDWQKLNEPIKKSFDFAKAVIVQSSFDKELISSFFGKRDQVYVIQNGTDLEIISKIIPAFDNNIIPKEKVWMCASSWRPHKRLDENIRLFIERADNDSILLIAGSNIEKNINDSRIKILGDLSWEQMISYMKSSGNFIHLAWLDHCPNVVIDAKAAGCRLHVANSGGTHEIISINDCLYEDSQFDFSTIDLYKPPLMRLCEVKIEKLKEIDISISKIAEKYYNILRNVYENN